MSTYTQLTQAQRYQISALRKAGHAQWWRYTSLYPNAPRPQISGNLCGKKCHPRGGRILVGGMIFEN